MALTGIKRGSVNTSTGTLLPDVEIRYPADDDEPMADSEPQYYAITDAVFALKEHFQRQGWAGTVRGNCALYYDPGNLTAYVAPDVLVAFDVLVPENEGYAPWEYGKVPDLVMEMASATTHVQDSGPKHARYAALGIVEYWQYDPHHQYLAEDLIGWRLQAGDYERIPLRHDPRRGAMVGMSRVLDTEWGLHRVSGALRLWDPSAQEWYLTDREAAAARWREAARADREAAARWQEAARADQEAAARRQEAARADREAAARRREAARADREAAARRQEAARADQAETEIARLQALLREAGTESADPLT